MRLATTPYAWGGDDPMGGLDCSGYVIELLQSCGILKHGTDYTSQALHDYLDKLGALGKPVPAFGDIVFYGRGGSTRLITHVGFALNRFIVMQSAGGNSKTKTLDDAIKQNAFVKPRPLDYRKDRAAILRPNYYMIGAA